MDLKKDMNKNDLINECTEPVFPSDEASSRATASAPSVLRSGLTNETIIIM